MLKTKTIKTDKVTILVVELPDRVKNIRIDTNQSVIPYGKEVTYEVPGTKESYGYEETEGFALPEGNWQLLGRLPDITEKQSDKVVENYIYNTREIDGHYDYENDTQTDCPIESLNSLIYINEVYFENPFQDPGLMPSAELDLYRQAQSKVWDKERCYLFIKVD